MGNSLFNLKRSSNHRRHNQESECDADHLKLLLAAPSPSLSLWVGPPILDAAVLTTRAKRGEEEGKTKIG